MRDILRRRHSADNQLSLCIIIDRRGRLAYKQRVGKGFEVIVTDNFSDWLRDLRDSRAQKRIATRLLRFEKGNWGDAKPVGEAVYEARIDYGGGYRLYYARAGEVIIVMLCGGDKSSQKRDIAKAKELKKDLEQWLLS